MRIVAVSCLFGGWELRMMYDVKLNTTFIKRHRTQSSVLKPLVPRLCACMFYSNPFTIRSSEPDIYTTFSFLLFDRNIEYDELVNAKTRKL